MECRSDLWVHGDQHVLLSRDGGIPLIDPFADPGPELVANNARSDIDNPLLRCLPELLVVGQKGDHLFMPEEFIEDIGELQILIGWHMDMDDAVHRNEFLLAFNDGFHKIRAERMNRRQIGLDVNSEEGEDLYEHMHQHRNKLTSLAPELRRKGC